MDLKQFQCLAFQTVGNRCNRIGVVDAKFHSRLVARVTPHQGDVCSVKRGHYFDVYSLFFEHLFGHISGICMWNCIMHVQNIQVVGFDNTHHFRRECQLVGLEFKERVFFYFYLMKMQAARNNIQSNRLVVGNKVHLVPLIGQRHSKFRSDNTTPSKSRVTNNSDIHKVFFNKCRRVFL